MKKMKLKAKILLLSAIMLVMLASSCKRDTDAAWIPATPPAAATGKAALFTSAISGDTLSRITAGNWLPSDLVNITMLGLRDSVVLTGNKKYTPDAAGRFKPQGDGELIGYPSAGTLVNFVACYPFQEGADSVYKANLSAQGNLAAIDLMYASNATNFNVESRTTPHLQFEHQLAKITLNIKKLPGSPDVMKDMTVTIKELSATGDFDLKKGRFTNLAVGDITPVVIPAVAAPQTDTTQVATFLAIPENAEGKLVEIKLSTGKVYRWAFPAGALLVKGKAYHFDAILDPYIQKVLFTEGFGTEALGTGNKNFNAYTSYDNGVGLTLAGTIGAGRVQAASGSFVGNIARFAATATQNLLIGNINTAGYKNLTLQFKVASANAPSNGVADFADLITIKYNGVAYPLPGSTFTKSNAINIVDVDLSAAPASTGGAIEFIVNPKLPSIYNILLDDIKLSGKILDTN